MNAAPLVAALAVVVSKGKVLLVRRQNEPDAELWGFPGGHLELGETVPECAVRELMEETGVRAIAGPLITNIDVIRKDDSGGVRYHFVLVAVQCAYVSGDPVASDDVTDAKWVDIKDIAERILPMSRYVDTVCSLATRATRTRDSYLLDLD